MKKILFFMTAIIIVSLFSTCGKYGEVVKILNRINDSASHYWKEIILKYGIDAMDTDGDTILSAAIEGKNLELTEAILKNKFNPNRHVKNDYSAFRYTWMLYNLSKDSGLLPIMKILMKYNASPIEKEWNCLTEAIKYKYFAVIDIILPFYANNKLLDFSDAKDAYSCILFTGHTYQSNDNPSKDPELIEMIKKLCDTGFFPTENDFSTIIEQYVNIHVDNNNASILKNIIEKLALSGKYSNIDTVDSGEGWLEDTANRDINFKERRPERYIAIFPVLVEKGIWFYNFPPDNNLYAKKYIAAVMYFRKQGSQIDSENIAFCNRTGRAHWENIWTLQASDQFFKLVDSYYNSGVIKEDFISVVTGFEADLTKSKTVILLKFDENVNRISSNNADRYRLRTFFYGGEYKNYLYNSIDDAEIHKDLRNYYFEYLDKDIHERYSKYFDLYSW